MLQWAFLKQHKQKGFTIVELLIVIVVIGILAAITLIAYSGIQNRAKIALLQTDLETASKKFETEKVNNAITSGAETYPVDLAAAQALIKGSSGTTFPAYFANNTISPAEFCLGASNGGLYYTIATGLGPQPGQCVTNYILNPSLESNLASWGAANGATYSSAPVAGSAIFGSYGVQFAAPASSQDSGASVANSLTTTPGVSYTASVSVRAITAGTYRLSIQGAGATTNPNVDKVMTAGQVARLSLSWTSSTTGAVNFYILRPGNVGTAETFDADGAMLTATAGLVPFMPGYADGNTDGWWWTGATNNSTSIGAGVAQ